LLLVADVNHTVSKSAASICHQIEEAFEAEGFSSECSKRISSSLRAARGLSVQHDPAFALNVASLESYLGEEGHTESDWEGFSEVWQRPYKARFLQSVMARILAAKAEGGGGVCNVCSVGFGTGHTALLLLTTGDSSSSVAVHVYSFDRATARSAIPAQDYLDIRYPEKNFLFLGDPPLAIARFKSAFPEIRCDLLLVDPNGMQPLLGNATAQALRSLSSLAAQDGLLTLVSTHPRISPNQGERHSPEQPGGGPPPPLPPGEVWKQAEAAGWIAWEGTLLQALERPDGDALLYGKFTLSGLTPTNKLPVESH